MKSFYPFCVFIFFSLLCAGQSSLNDCTLTFNKPLICSNITGHSDGLNLAKEIEKSYNSGTVRTMRFKINFDGNCAYNFATDADSNIDPVNHNTDPGNQLDWNKVMQISTYPNSDKTSVRLGWRFNTQKGKMELGLYGHIKHIGNNTMTVYSCGDYIGREFFYLTDIDVETDIDVVMIMTYDELLVRANGNEGSIKRFLNMEACDVIGSTKTAFKRSAYFGGQECPTHDMDIRVKNILIDYDYNSIPTNKTFARSVFYSNEIKNICAYNAINLSYEAERGQDGTTFAPKLWSVEEPVNVFDGGNGRYTIIQAGSVVSATAGFEINLLPGFHAVAGSDFTAKIATPGCGNFYDARIAYHDSSNIIDESLVASSESIIGSQILYNDFQTIIEHEKKDSLVVILNEEIVSKIVANLTFKISIYPNPNKGEFVLELNNVPNGNYNLQITDALGRSVIQQTINVHEQNLKQNINLQAHGKGIYFVKINSEQINEVRKVVVE